MPRKLAPDVWLFGVAVVLLSVGVVMVYSASAIVATDRFHDPYFFLKKQVFWALLGAGCMWMAIRLDYRRLEGLVFPLLILAGVLLVLVLVSPLGQAINGTRRWIRLGPVSFQPAELAKLALVLYLAAFLAKKGEEIADLRRGLLPPLAVAGVLAALVLAQPDLGNCLTLITLTFTLLFLAGGRARHLGFILAAALPPLVVAVWAAPYRLRRIVAFIDPWSDPRGSGFQIIQSWLALGNGGVFGQGIGASRQKLFYLPESHTDFIFAILGEELGFVGALDVRRGVADDDLRAELGEPLDGVVPLLVGAGHAVAEVQQYFGDPGHAAAADSDEVDLLVALKHGRAGRCSGALPSRAS